MEVKLHSRVIRIAYLVFSFLATLLTTEATMAAETYEVKLKKGKVLNNEDITELCKGAEYGDVARGQLVSGAQVQMRLSADGFAPRERQIKLSYTGRSGAYAQKILVNAIYSKANIPKNLKKGVVVLLNGRFKPSNVFIANGTDLCFIDITADKITIYGF